MVPICLLQQTNSWAHIQLLLHKSNCRLQNSHILVISRLRWHKTMMCSMRRKNHNDRNLCSSLISTRKPSKEGKF
jgi:hypothetical protein